MGSTVGRRSRRHGRSARYRGEQRGRTTPRAGQTVPPNCVDAAVEIEINKLPPEEAALVRQRFAPVRSSSLVPPGSVAGSALKRWG